MIKKYPLISFIFIALLLFFTGCQAEGSYLKEEAPIQKRPSSDKGIKLSTEKAVYKTSDNEITINIQNDSDTQFSYGQDFAIEKKVKDAWYSVPFKDKSFEEKGTLLHPKTSTSQTFSLEQLEYNLSSGKYRIVVTFYNPEDYFLILKKEGNTPKGAPTLAAPFKVVK
ncbi:immunoglobulin-like domain-containing protein [Pseudobacillus badius]|uniref:immunoglobulin-like domain-containing protein n=1 Tax=Bacillus badius TaxID=1455 RepID=UPI0007B0A1B0|nr:immunoglobulin-like domain-containing protein [Bacillus badius]KZN99846.1 hypothetical protein A4244_17810 [Bacillus badius]OCS85950.1 hypothetical protein A6M11_17825 [Bacillus badius]OVE51690.1 hypothetical protein B1A98_09000 [Bacillus badius]TDW03105.1 hypothetical protein B0G66_1047 [Bacillus badius]